MLRPDNAESANSKRFILIEPSHLFFYLSNFSISRLYLSTYQLNIILIVDSVNLQILNICIRYDQINI